jgi:putative transposase
LDLIAFHLFLYSLQQRLLSTFTVVASEFETSAQLRVGNLALRQQLMVLRRSTPKRLKLRTVDRIFWLWLRRVWADWSSYLVMVKSETVVAWHRKRLSSILAMEEPERQARKTWCVARGSRSDSDDESQQPTLGAPRIHGELKLDIETTESTIAKYMVRSRKPPSQSWRTFLNNHVKRMVSVDFFVVPTVRFQILYVFLVLAHDRRRIIHFAVPAHPTAEWTAQQLREAFPWYRVPRYLLRDRDRIFGHEFTAQVKAMGIKQVLSAPRAPWPRAYVERLIGSIRRECLDHVIVFNEGSLHRTLTSFSSYFHNWRTHLSLGKDAARPADTNSRRRYHHRDLRSRWLASSLRTPNCLTYITTSREVI